MVSILKKSLVTSLVLSSFTVTGCGVKSADSSQKVTHVVSTPSKRQSIGNCWIYAQASWLETLLQKSSGKALNVSETYWTYWDWYSKITRNPWQAPLDISTDASGKETVSFQTGGNWSEAKFIILEYGFLYEDEVAPEEANLEMSMRQSSAETMIEFELTKGELSTEEARQDSDKVKRVLDKIFGVKMEELVEKGRENLKTEVAVGKKLDKKAPLSEAIEYWRDIYFDMAWGVSDASKLEESTLEARKIAFQKVMRALNDGQPVLMSFQVYFDALKIDRENRMGIFDYETLMNFKKTQTINPSRVGGHMVMLQDYAVNNVPGHGNLGFGDMSDEVKAAAVEGELTMIKAKNSWGVSREDRGLFDGSSVFDIRYLTMPIEQSPDQYNANLWDFVVPEYPEGL